MDGVLARFPPERERLRFVSIYLENIPSVLPPPAPTYGLLDARTKVVGETSQVGPRMGKQAIGKLSKVISDGGDAVTLSKESGTVQRKDF